MKQKRSLILPAVFTAAGLAVLLSLGFWQLERLEWKTELLERIAENMAAPPLTLPENIGRSQLPETMDWSRWEYRHVCAEGGFLHGKEMHLFATDVHSGEAGYHVYTPFKRESGSAVIINRGWVPPAKKDPATREESQVEGATIVCGIFRLSRKKGWFTPHNQPTFNEWYYPDGEQMAQAAGLETPHPVFIDADEAESAGSYPVGGQTRVDIPNNHLGYAITWFGLAAALLGVFIVFAWGRRRR